MYVSLPTLAATISALAKAHSHEPTSAIAGFESLAAFVTEMSNLNAEIGKSLKGKEDFRAYNGVGIVLSDPGGRIYNHLEGDIRSCSLFTKNKCGYDRGGLANTHVGYFNKSGKFDVDKNSVVGFYLATPVQVGLQKDKTVHETGLLVRQI